MKKSKRALVAMSGGVDSSVVAAIMKNRLQCDVVGVTLNMFESEMTKQGIVDAQKVADRLKIEHCIVDCVDVFKRHVIDYLKSHRLSGLTPNPCIMCNANVKFSELNKFAERSDCDVIATGHYARLNVTNENIALSRATDEQKDQSYFLYRVSRNILYKCKFPLGELFKINETRSIAREFNLPVAAKKDSQDVCFATTDWYRVFSQSKIGNIATENGTYIGTHKGVHNYTIGQRSGLGLSGGPYFVKNVVAQDNLIIVTKTKPCNRKITLANTTWLNNPFSGRCYAKIRSRSPMARCYVDGDIVTLDDKDVISLGQHCVLYDQNGQVIGGGEIANAFD